jgi:uncharacterized protein YjiS (DUF1127 family)
MNTLFAIAARAAGPTGYVKSALSSIATALATAKQRHDTHRALASLSDRSLHDIGLDRSMLMSAAIHGRRSPNEPASARAPETLADKRTNQHQEK